MEGVEVRSRNSRRSFTLLELVIASVIIAILASLGVGYYRKVMVKAKVGKARHAISLIAQAEEVYRMDNGTYTAISSGAVETTVGTNVTGMNLSAVDNDTDFNYSATGAGLVEAKNSAVIGGCAVNTAISLDLVTDIWVIPACYK